MDSNKQDTNALASESLLEQAEALIWSLLDDEIEPADVRKLEEMLKGDQLVRERYIECVQMHTDLYQHFGVPQEQETEPTQLPKSPVLGMLGDLRPGTDTLPISE